MISSSSRSSSSGPLCKSKLDEVDLDAWCFAVDTPGAPESLLGSTHALRSYSKWPGKVDVVRAHKCGPTVRPEKASRRSYASGRSHGACGGRAETRAPSSAIMDAGRPRFRPSPSQRGLRRGDCRATCSKGGCAFARTIVRPALGPRPHSCHVVSALGGKAKEVDLAVSVK